VLRSFDFILAADLLAGGASTFVRHFIHRRNLFVALRLLLARPLWWLAARFLSVSDRQGRYNQFSTRALARWESFLLGDEDGKR
jgi:hypothetical protein